MSSRFISLLHDIHDLLAENEAELVKASGDKEDSNPKLKMLEDILLNVVDKEGVSSACGCLDVSCYLKALICVYRYINLSWISCQCYHVNIDMKDDIKASQVCHTYPQWVHNNRWP